MHIISKQGSTDNVLTYEHICDTSADMAKIDRKYITLGSVCIILAGESGAMEVYMADSNKEWHDILAGASSGGSTPSGLTLHICTQNEVSNGKPNIEFPLETELYLVPSGAESGNLYDEYIWVNGAWELFGGANIDLTGYATQAWVSQQGYLSSFTETDPTVPAWAKAATKPTYTAAEVGALPADTQIPTVPTNISAFTNDVNYLSNPEATTMVENWLESNITTGNVIDTSLTIEGAGADAKKTGDEISNLKSAFNNNISFAGESINDEITQIPLDWESGTITNGSDQPNTHCIRTKGYLCVFDWATLKVNQTAADPALYISEYDKDQVFLKRYAYYVVGDHTPQEAGCRFIRLATYSATVPAEQHSQYFTAYYDNQYSVSKLYSTPSEYKAEQQIVNRNVVGADIKLASAAYEIGANKNNDGNATYILKNISFPVINGDMLHVKCDDITNALQSTPICIYQYNSGGTQVGINQYTKAAIIKGIDIIPNTDTASVTVRLYPSISGGLTDTTAVYTNIIIYLSKRNSNFDYLSKKTARIFKKVVCVGDSYTEGWFKAPGESERTLDPDYAWPHYMSDITGNHWMNCGVSGATTLSWLTNANGLAKAQTLGVSQAYVIGLMINDISSVTLGTSSDIGTDSPTTYYGGLSKIIRELATISPNAHIFVNTCPKTETNYNDFNNAVRTVVNAYKDTYKVYCIDLSANAELYDVPSFTGDAINGHYTAIGYEQMAEIYCYLLSNYINNHISTFQDVYKLPFDPVN